MKGRGKCSPGEQFISDSIRVAKDFRRKINKAFNVEKQAQCYVTKLKWEYGTFLVALRAKCKHGEWGTVLAAIPLDEPRYSELAKIAKHFKSAEDAAAVPFKRAMRKIRIASADPYERCFATPQWLRDAITRDYGFPALDVCASHKMHFGEKWYSPLDDEYGKGAIGFDALRQSWHRDCPKGIAWCNAPYDSDTLKAFTAKCQHESEHGLTIVHLVPQWFRYTNYASDFGDTIAARCELRRPAQHVLQMGFGPKENKAAQVGRNYINVLVAIWRRGQTGCEGETIYPVGKEPKTLRQCWQTPKPLFNALHAVCKFSIDACADKSNHLLPKYWDEQHDARKQDWRNVRAFVNPPFASIASFLSKCCEAKVAAVIMPADSITSSYFAECPPKFLIVPKGRIEFVPPKGIQAASSPKFGSVIAFYGSQLDSLDLNRLAKLGLRFVFVSD